MYNQLVEHIRKYDSAILAFSGGVDSSLLAIALRDSGIKYLTMTVQSEFLSEAEVAQSISFCQEQGIEHIVTPVNILQNQKVKSNDKNRCYYCKTEIFQTIREFSKEQGFNTVFDGSQKDDLSSYRPGRKALEELQIISPFIDLGWSKSDIRKVSLTKKLSTANKESSPCLATRIPYGKELSDELLFKVEKSEIVLRNLGLTNFRCRIHDNLLRIEANNVTKALELAQIANKSLETIGFDFITVDVLGYQKGCFDEKN